MVQPYAICENDIFADLVEQGRSRKGGFSTPILGKAELQRSCSAPGP